MNLDIVTNAFNNVGLISASTRRTKQEHMNEYVDLLCLSLVKFLFSVNCVMMLTHHLCSALSTPKVETPLTELWSFVNSRIDFGAKL